MKIYKTKIQKISDTVTPFAGISFVNAAFNRKSEKIFDIQNNDFGWKHLPCSDMNYNTVYLIMTAMIKNFYSYLAGKVSLVFKDIKPATRLKRFIFRFISVAGQWVYRHR
jgi:hypothetical protein